MNRATCCRDRRSVGFPFWTSLYRQADQIRRDLRNAGERGVRVVLFANAEELNRKHHLLWPLCALCSVSDRLSPWGGQYLLTGGFAGFMSNESLLVILIVGPVAGWLAGPFVRGAGFGLLGDLLIGIIGHSLANDCCLKSVSILELALSS